MYGKIKKVVPQKKPKTKNQNKQTNDHVKQDTEKKAPKFKKKTYTKPKPNFPSSDQNPHMYVS